jgi:carboxymethylenebutenolidase
MALDRRIVELYDEYTHKPLDRRSFMNRLIAIAGSAAAAEAALALLEPNYAQAQQVAADDARIESRRIDETVGGVRLKGYLVTPKAQAKRGGVLVIHENRGLNPHIEDVTRRAALAGFTALGVDFLTPLGGTPADADAARALFAQLKPEDVVAQGRAALAFLKARPDTTGKVGAVGFCWGRRRGQRSRRQRAGAQCRRRLLWALAGSFQGAADQGPAADPTRLSRYALGRGAAGL